MVAALLNIRVDGDAKESNAINHAICGRCRNAYLSKTSDEQAFALSKYNRDIDVSKGMNKYLLEKLIFMFYSTSPFFSLLIYFFTRLLQKKRHFFFTYSPTKYIVLITYCLSHFS